MKPVIACFVFDKEKNEQTTGNADGQPQYVDERECFVAPKGPEGCFQIILKHRSVVVWSERVRVGS